MFARKVAVRLKPNSLTEFTNLIEREILPWLKKQEGFLDLITLAVPDGSEVATISFWDHEGNAQTYNSGGYPQVFEVLGKLFDGTPYVKTFDVVSPTLQRVALVRPTEAEDQAQETGFSQIGYSSYERVSDGPWPGPKVPRMRSASAGAHRSCRPRRWVPGLLTLGRLERRMADSRRSPQVSMPAYSGPPYPSE